MSTPFLRSMIAHAAIGGIARPAVNRAFPDGVPSFQQFYNEQEQTFGGLVPLMIKILKWSGIMLALLLLSGTSYGLFYSAIMPANYATEQLFFDYSRSSASPIQGIFTPRKIEDDSFVTPWASVDLFASHTPWQAFHDDVLPSPRASKRLLQSRQAYYIEIVLKLPESEQNLKAGMFTVVTELLSHDGSQLAASRRSVRLPHMSRWISNTRKFICLIPLMIGAMDESRVLIIPAFRYFVESEQLPLQHSLIKILTQSDSSLVEIIGGELRIGKELNVFQEFLKHWFYTCYTVGTIMFACFYYIEWLLLRIVWRWVKRYYNNSIDEPPCELDLDGSSFATFSRPTSPNDPFADVPTRNEGNNSTFHPHPDVPRSDDPIHRNDSWNTMETRSDSQWEDIYYPAEG